MKTLWRVLSGLCAAALVLVNMPGLGAAVQAQTCTELLSDGGFETGAGWQLGASPVTPQYVTYAQHSGYRALALGITSGANIESFSSARQTVSLPAAGPQARLSFWFYALADSPATTDYMELVLLDATGSAIISKPWRSHNDSRVWNQMTFDLTPWLGQTVQVYFNVYNDGVGGRAALFLDDVSLQICSGAAVTPTPTGTPPATSSPATLTPSPSPTPGCIDLVTDGGFNNGQANWQIIGDPAGAGAVSTPARSAPFALRLGSLEQPLNSLNTARQLAPIPAGYPLVTLEAWVFTQTQAGAGADYQQVALLDASGGPLYMPWQGQENNAAWQLLTFNVSAFAGQTVFVSFSVNNDGAGGRTVMYVDDVRLRACAPGAAASATPTGTAAPSTTPTAPAATPTAPPSGCTNLLQDSGFESGALQWRVGASTLPAQRVTAPVHNGLCAMQLGSQIGNDNTYSSIRQTVTVPWNRPKVVVSFWAYTWAEALTGADRQQFVLLGPGDQVWATPWARLDNTQAWQQYTFDLVGTAGLAFDLYFNAINDGLGGRTALFIDEVYAWACTPDAYPEALGAPAAVTTGLPGMTDRSAVMGGSAPTPAANSTTVALLPLATQSPPANARALAQSPEAAATQQPAGEPPEPPATGWLEQFNRFLPNWSLGQALLIGGIAVVLLLILILATKKLR